MSLQTTIIHIDGMTCGGCVKSVTHALNQITGISRVDVSLDNHCASIDFDNSQTNEASLKQAIEDAGFEVA
jgi:copper chaperone